MSAIFPSFFRQQLFLTPTLMNSVSVSVAYFAQHASFTDPYDPRYVDVRTLADLQAKLGWGTPLSPTTTPQTLGTITSGNNVYVIANNPFVNGGGWTDVPVGAAAFFINGTVGGVVNPVILITDTPFDGSVFRAADSLTAAPNAAISNNRAILAWQTPAVGATQVLPTEGPLVQFKAPPNYEASHQEHAWLFPQRVNMLANPSFELGTNHWRTNGALSRIHPPRDPLVWEGRVVGAAPLVLESNLFPAHLTDRSGLWTIQLMVRGNGRIRVGLVSWESGFDETGVDWGPDTDIWTLSADGYQHIYALRRVGEATAGLVRIECDGTEFFVDELLCEPEWLPGWPYFDGDTTYGVEGDYSWYGGASRRGQSFSLWYNHRRAVIGRLFSWSISDNDFTVTDSEIEGQGFVYGWVPAGVRVIPHMDVLWVGDVQPVVPAVSGSVLAVKAWSTDALGVQSAWSSSTPSLLPSNNVFPSPGLFPGSSVIYPWTPYPATTLFPSSTLFPD